MKSFFTIWGILVGGCLGAVFLVLFLAFLGEIIFNLFGEPGFWVYLFLGFTGAVAWFVKGME